MKNIDKKIKENLNRKPTEKYNQMISKTIDLIKSEEISQNGSKLVNFKKTKKSSFKRIFQNVAAIAVVGILGVTTYAGVTGKIDINIGNTGHNKIDKNYNDVATVVDKVIDNEYFTFSLNSMAADPTYLIFEYDIKLKDAGIEKVGEVQYDEFNGYKISLQTETYINDKEIVSSYGREFKKIQKISDREFKIAEFYTIADIKSNQLHIKKNINNIVFWEDNIVDKQGYCYSDYNVTLNVDIAQELSLDVKFKDNERKILAQTELTNGSTLYIEEVSNSKFENFVLARIVSKTIPKSEMLPNKTVEFMIEDAEFAICNQNDETINFDRYSLDTIYEKILTDGSIEQYEILSSDYFDDTDMVRTQQVQLLRLVFDDANIPEKIKLLPINRKLYNDRNNSEYNFYMNEDWYQVKNGEVNITEESQIGGSITITKIDEVDDNIIFYYDKKGYVPFDIDFVLRVKNSKINYFCPRCSKNKGIDSNENKIIYTKDTGMLAGIPKLGYSRLDNLNDLEFAMFYNTKYDVLSEALEFEWNKVESDNTAQIENIKFSEFLITINEELENCLEGKSNHLVYVGSITEVNSKYLKFFYEFENKEITISNPSKFKYIDGRNNEDLEFSKIKVGDIFWIADYGMIKDYDEFNGYKRFDKLTILRNYSNEKLKKELLKQMSVVQGFKYSLEYQYRILKEVEILNENEAILTVEFLDPYKYITNSDESFIGKFKVNNETQIYSDWYDIFFSDIYSVKDLKNIDYDSHNFNIMIDENTINNDVPTVTKMQIELKK